MKIELVKNGNFEPGEIDVVGKEPVAKPYVWIGENNGRCLAVIDTRTMNALIKKWMRATNKKSK